MLGDILRSRSLGLVFFGVVLLLGSSGTVTSEVLGFVPMEDTNDAARFVLVTTGGTLILGGLTTTLRESSIYSPPFSWLHLAVTVALIGGFAVLFALREPSVEAHKPVFQRWNATFTEFDAVIDMEPYEQYADSHDVLLVCRIIDPVVPPDDDELISVSALFPIERGNEQRIRVQFNQNFSERLSPNDDVECHLALLPKGGGGSEDVKSLGQLEHELDGQRLDRFVSDRVSECSPPPKAPVDVNDSAN